MGGELHEQLDVRAHASAQRILLGAARVELQDLGLPDATPHEPQRTQLVAAQPLRAGTTAKIKRKTPMGFRGLRNPVGVFRFIFAAIPG